MKLKLRSGSAVDFPRSPQDITLAQYVNWHNEVKPTVPDEVMQYNALVLQLQEIEKDLDKYYKQSGATTPDELQEYLNSGRAKNNAKRFLPGYLSQWYETVEQMEALYMINDPLWISKNWHPFQLRVVRSLTNITDELTVDELQYLFDKCTAAIQEPKDLTYKQIYQHEGIIYTLPDKAMSKSTLIEFAEAAQYEAALKQAEKGDANGLLKMCAVLLRPSGADTYSEEVFEQNVKAFQTLPLQVAYEVGFFLMWLSSEYALNISRFTLAGAVRQMQD